MLNKQHLNDTKMRSSHPFARKLNILPECNWTTVLGRQHKMSEMLIWLFMHPK